SPSPLIIPESNFAESRKGRKIPEPPARRRKCACWRFRCHEVHELAGSEQKCQTLEYRKGWEMVFALPSAPAH
ncbi:MAG: hypothetical protein ACWGQW_08725, partial [bacterium]